MSFSYNLLRLGRTVGVTHEYFIAVKKMEQDNGL